MIKPTVEELRRAFSYDRQSGFLIGRSGRIVGFMSRDGYLHVKFGGRPYSSHLLIWAIVTGAYPLGTVDHRNLNRADNRWENLREATEAQQQVNRSLFKNNKSGYRGVYRTKGGKWCAQIRFDKKTRSLGVYDSAEEASAIVQQARETRWGEFAVAA